MEENFYIDPPSDDPDEYRPMLAKAVECFASSIPFLRGMGFELPEPTIEDRKEAMHIYHNTPMAPSKPSTLGTAVVLDSMLAKYDYALNDPMHKMRNYVMYKFFEHAENEDPKISLKALEYLAKSSEVGLFTDRVEINIHEKPTEELKSELTSLISSILIRAKPGTVIDVTDAEFVNKP